MAKFIAIGSGKGGVGKSTISVNLALCAVRRGLRTALIDVDPLSNLAVIMDIREEELAAYPEDLSSRNIKNYRFPVCRGLDLLFPRAKLSPEQVETLAQRIFVDFYQNIVEDYDIVFFDMPAGIQTNEGLHLLPKMGSLVLVLNPEPTSHVSAGGYLRAVLDITPGIQVQILHNRFNPQRSDPSFRNRDVIGNYNRFVSREFTILPEEAGQILELGTVALDPALSILHTEPDFSDHLLFWLEDTLRLLLELYTTVPTEQSFPQAGLVLRRLLRYAYLYNGSKPELADIIEYMQNISGQLDVFSLDDFNRNLQSYHLALQKNKKRSDVFVMLDIIDAFRRSDQSSAAAKHLFRVLIARIRQLFLLVTQNIESKIEKNAMGLLLYYVSCSKLFLHPVMANLFRRLIPTIRHSAGSAGSARRDRRRQILALLHGDKAIQNAFESAIETVFPLIRKQLIGFASTNEVWDLLYTEGEEGNRSLNEGAYKLLTRRFLHDLMFAGLGVAVGLKDSAAGRSIEEAFEALYG